MGKKEKKQVGQQIDKAGTNADANINPQISGLKNKNQQSEAANTATRGQISSGYGDLAGGSMYGITADDISRLRNTGSGDGISRESLLDFEKTGGYTPQDIANTRARANSGVPALYANMKQGLGFQQARGNSAGPNWGALNSKLTRQGAQDLGEQNRNTELGINDQIRGNRMVAANTLAGNNLSLAGMNAQNERSLMGLKQQGVSEGLSGLSNLYGQGLSEQQANQGLLRGYTGDRSNIDQNLINARINQGQMKGGFTDTLKDVTGIAGGVMGGMTGIGLPFGGKSKPLSGRGYGVLK